MTGYIDRRCEVCDKPFVVRKIVVERGNGRYCSNKCKTIALANKLKKRIVVSCEFCGEEFEITPSKKKAGYGKFCPRECYNLSRKVKKPCEQCGKIIMVQKSRFKYGQGKYCSRECRDLSRKTKIEKTCESCGKTFEIMKSAHKKGFGRFCSKECQHKGMSGEGSPTWQGGISYGKYCPKFNNEFKERVREFFGRKCQLCGAEENGRKLSVHHVTYEKDACCNGQIAMFVPLCPTCHSKTNYNRDYWQEYFFNYINVYYDGKSYIGQEDVVYYGSE